VLAVSLCIELRNGSFKREISRNDMTFTGGRLLNFYRLLLKEWF